jgi:uncharacterized SAM-dependent methyltransferase
MLNSKYDDAYGLREKFKKDCLALKNVESKTTFFRARHFSRRPWVIVE